MSFEDMKTATLLRQHNRTVEAYNLQNSTQTKESGEWYSRLAREVDGVLVSIQLANWCEALRKTNRHLKFGVPRGAKSLWVNDTNLLSELWAYLPGDEYAIMRLGFADYALRGTANRYGVYARGIRNDKYHAGRDQYHMAITDNFDRAVKNARKYMVPYSLAEVANMSLGNIQQEIVLLTIAASSEFNDIHTKIIQHSAFVHELERFAAIGFHDAEFGELVRTYMDKRKERNERLAQQHHAYFVSVRELNGKQVFDILTVLDVPKTSLRNMGTHRTYTAEEVDVLDDTLLGKIATLSMLDTVGDNNAFVDGLGLKLNDTSYWVLK